MPESQCFDITVPGPPIPKNRRHRIVTAGGRRGARPFLVNTQRYTDWCDALAVQWAARRYPRLGAGGWDLEVRAYWPRQRHLDQSFAFGDIDAPVSAVLDALQRCEAIDDDIRFVHVKLHKAYDKTNPAGRDSHPPAPKGFPCTKPQ